MENLIIKSTKNTPEVNFDFNSGIFTISGNSYPENTLEFYERILDCLEEYFNTTSNKEIELNIEIIYFNSSSSRVFFEIFDLLEEVSTKINIKINWVYEKDNESVIEIGEDFKEDFEKLNFNFVVKQ